MSKSGDVKARFYEELEQVFDKFPKDHMNILLGDFIGKVGGKDIFSDSSLLSHRITETTVQ
jgi:hypothetical protein